MPKEITKKLLWNIVRVVVGIVILLLFSFCMWYGSITVGKKQIEILTNDSIPKYDTLSSEMEHDTIY